MNYYFKEINRKLDEILEKLDKINNPEDMVFVLKGYSSEPSEFWDKIIEQKLEE